MRGHNLKIKQEIRGIKEGFLLRDVIKESIHVREDSQEKKIQEIIHQKSMLRKFIENKNWKLQN